jgi:hypothetical protein
MTLYLLFIDKAQILTVYNVLLMYPIDNIFIKQLNDNCIDLETELSEHLLNETLKDYFYKIGFFNTYLILDTSLDFEVIL